MWEGTESRHPLRICHHSGEFGATHSVSPANHLAPLFLQMRALRSGEIKFPVQGNPTSHGVGWDLNPAPSD